MKKIFILLLLLFYTMPIFAKELLVFAGSASKPPLEEIAKEFEDKTGVKVRLVFGGSGYVLSQMKLTKKGDIYFPGSSDYMEIAKKQKLVYPKSQKIVVYLVSSINVQKGNPKHIHSLKDLTKPGIKVVIANPEGVCVGSYAVEIIEKNFNEKEKKQFRKNIINYTPSCSKTANVITLKQADAIIGWRVFAFWNPDKIENVKLKSNELVRIGYIPIAISKYTKDKKLAQMFIDFVVSNSGKKIFKKYHYLSSKKEAFDYVGKEKRVGGEYKVPKSWLNGF